VIGGRMYKLKLPEHHKRPDGTSGSSSSSSSSDGARRDPGANLTFNVSLTPLQRSAREAVVLPYTHHLHSQQQQQQYADVDDEDDDDDDEDPDDDLDI